MSGGKRKRKKGGKDQPLNVGLKYSFLENAMCPRMAGIDEREREREHAPHNEQRLRATIATLMLFLASSACLHVYPAHILCTTHIAFFILYTHQCFLTCQLQRDSVPGYHCCLFV